MRPILTARCVGCHDGTRGEGKYAPNLIGAAAGQFTLSYESLKPFVQWYEWGGGIGGDVTRPGHMPADESPLTKILYDLHHAGRIELTDRERRTIYLWIDGNAPFYGTYVETAQLARQRGQRVPLPGLQ